MYTNEQSRRGTEWANIEWIGRGRAATWRLLVIIDLLRQPTQLRPVRAPVDTIAPKWISRDRIVEILTVRRRCCRLDSQPASIPPFRSLQSPYFVSIPSSPAASFCACLSTSSSSILKRERQERRRTTESRCGSVIVLSPSFVRQRTPRLTVISLCLSLLFLLR